MLDGAISVFGGNGMKKITVLPIDLQLFADGAADEGFNAFSNLEEFVGGSEEAEDIEVEEEEEIEIEDEAESEEEETDVETEDEPDATAKKPAKKVDTEEPKKPMSKQEYALVQEKRKNKDILKLVESLVNEVKELKGAETERSQAKKKETLITKYIEQGYEEAAATMFADKDMKIDSVSSEVESLKKMFEELASGKQSSFDTKTQAEQTMLYKQGKAQKVKTETTATPDTRETVKMTAEMKKDYEKAKKTPWGKTMSASAFAKSWKESFQ